MFSYFSDPYYVHRKGVKDLCYRQFLAIFHGLGDTWRYANHITPITHHHVCYCNCDHYHIFAQGHDYNFFPFWLFADVASNWLSCFPLTAKKLVYDVFFVKGLMIEVVQALIPSLDHNSNAVRSNAERWVTKLPLLMLDLLFILLIFLIAYSHSPVMFEGNLSIIRCNFEFSYCHMTY